MNGLRLHTVRFNLDKIEQSVRSWVLGNWLIALVAIGVHASRLLTVSEKARHGLSLFRSARLYSHSRSTLQRNNDGQLLHCRGSFEVMRKTTSLRLLRLNGFRLLIFIYMVYEVRAVPLEPREW